jgi:histidine triad (HIT) family protein
MLSDEETIEIKQKLISQIESTFPPEQILSAKSQIESMNHEQLENFLEKNKLIKNSEEERNNECVFCNIASGKINSVKLGENETAVAVLEINPISKGHFIVIPVEHTDYAQKEAMELAKKISKKIREKFSAKDIEISKSKMFGHEIINVLPVYNNENLNSERHHESMEELERIKEELEEEKEKKEEVKEDKTLKEKIEEFLWLPKRIP